MNLKELIEQRTYLISIANEPETSELQIEYLELEILEIDQRIDELTNNQ